MVRSSTLLHEKKDSRDEPISHKTETKERNKGLESNGIFERARIGFQARLYLSDSSPYLCIGD
jgi:hypothetical protein